ncbi:MAG: hypothetical protein QCH96_01705 [Candidatus Thermoplasmatota archaeon]|nr:hypothetical protein [Candidatus Thermoplasmatota archaeon]
MKNKYEKKKTIIFAVLLLMLLSTASSIVFASAQPTVTLNPEKPAPKSTVTFTADIADIDVTNVYIHVQECNGNLGLCYPDDSNVSMTQKSAYTYEASLTLKHSEATYIEFTLIVENNGEWIKYLELTKVTLSEKPSNNGGSANGTPGFDLVVFAFATIFISFILFRRRR